MVNSINRTINGRQVYVFAQRTVTSVSKYFFDTILSTYVYIYTLTKL